MSTRTKLAKTLVAASIGILFTSSALAFDVHTHAAMTSSAVKKSQLGNGAAESVVLKKLGLLDIEQEFGAEYVGFKPNNVLLKRKRSEYDTVIVEAFKLRPTGKDGTPGPLPHISLKLPTRFTVTGWMMRGNIREDDNTVETKGINAIDNDPEAVYSRVFGHFYDPVYDKGLPIVGAPAPSWALDSNATVLGNKNNYQLKDAREALWRALTLKQINTSNGASVATGSMTDVAAYVIAPNAATTAETRTLERKAYWAATFRTLGDMVHLIQDMGQPQHTRNEMHAGLGCVFPVSPDAPCLLGHDSFFEAYLKARTLNLPQFSTKEALLPPSPPPNPTNPANPTEPGPPGLKTYNIKAPLLDYDSYEAVVLSEYREYFAGPVSMQAGTTGPAKNANNATGKGLANYSNRGFYTAAKNVKGFWNDYDAPARDGAGLTTTVLEGVSLRNMAGEPITGKVTLLNGTVTDTYNTTKNEPNVPLSSIGAFDQFLKTQNSTETNYTLNYYNYDAQARLLVPRAVGYSAGFINRFFRGKLEITPPAEGVFSVVDHALFSGENAAVVQNATGFSGFKRIKLRLRNATPATAVPGATGPVVQENMTGGRLVAVLRFKRNLNYTPDLESELPGGLLYNVNPNRTTETEIIVSTAVRDAAGAEITGAVSVDTAYTTYYFDFFDQQLPINAVDVSLQVVYRGALGNEPDEVVVETLDISEPTYFSFYNATDHIVLDGAAYTAAQINADPVLLAKMRPLCVTTTPPIELVPLCATPVKFASAGIAFLATGTPTLAHRVGLVELPDAATYSRFAFLGPLANDGKGTEVRVPISLIACANRPPLEILGHTVLARVADIRSEYTYKMPTEFNATDDGAIYNSLVRVQNDPVGLAVRGLRLGASSYFCSYVGDNTNFDTLTAEQRRAIVGSMQGTVTGPAAKPKAVLDFKFGP